MTRPRHTYLGGDSTSGRRVDDQSISTELGAPVLDINRSIVSQPGPSARSQPVAEPSMKVIYRRVGSRTSREIAIYSSPMFILPRWGQRSTRTQKVARPSRVGGSYQPAIVGRRSAWSACASPDAVPEECVPRQTRCSARSSRATVSRSSRFAVVLPEAGTSTSIHLLRTERMLNECYIT